MTGNLFPAICPVLSKHLKHDLVPVYFLSVNIIQPTSLIVLRILRTNVYKHLAWYLPQSKHSGNFSSNIRYLLSFYFIFCLIYLKWQLQLLQVFVLPLIHVGGNYLEIHKCILNAHSVQSSLLGIMWVVPSGRNYKSSGGNRLTKWL